MHVRRTFLIGSLTALVIAMIASGPASAAAPIVGTPPVSQSTPPAVQPTRSPATAAQRVSPTIVDADQLITRVNASHAILVSANYASYLVVPDATPTGGIKSDTNDDGIVDDIYWEFPDGTWERVTDYDFDADADALAIDVTADGFAEIQIWDNEEGSYFVYTDCDGDAVFESQEFFLRSQLDDALPGLTEFLDIEFGPIGS
ncbi:MAG: hypothetical protein ABWZ98_13445 [Nakamurella sp.]